MSEPYMNREDKVSVAVFAILVIAITVAVFSAFPAPQPGYVPTGEPNFVTPSMIKRRGLTDEQYKALWAMGAHPAVDPAAVKELMFHSSRGKNIEEWIGDTMGDAELGPKIMATVETNKALVARNDMLERRHASDTNYIARVEAAYETQGHEIATLKEENFLLKEKYEAAKPAAAITVRIQTALREEGTLGPYLRAELVKMRDQTVDPKKREVFESCIALVDSAVNQDVRDSDMVQ